jgi:hypothetical protein
VPLTNHRRDTTETNRVGVAIRVRPAALARTGFLSVGFRSENGAESWIAFRHKLIDMTVAPLISRLENFGMSVEIDDVRTRERGRGEDQVQVLFRKQFQILVDANAASEDANWSWHIR